jgi:hypothetical protein
VLITFADLVDHVLAFGGTDAARETASNHRRAVQNAYRVLPTRHQWAYLWGIGRVTTTAPYTTGTVEFVASTRLLTLTDGTWPSWAASGFIYIENVPYDIETRVSDSVLKLTAATAPPDDIDAGTEYSLMRDRYAMPADLVAIDETTTNATGVTLEFVHPRAWSGPRRTNVGPGQPRAFTLIGNTGSRTTLNMALWPSPDAVYAIDFLYRRKPRALVYEQVSLGLASATVDGTTVTGSGTAFADAHVGSIFRFGADNQTTPTGDGGLAPAVHEATITAVASATSLTIDSAVPQTFDQVRYVISDPVDIFTPSMTELLLREIEKQWRLVCRTQPTQGEMQEYDMALTRAMEADNLSSERTAVYRGMSRRTRRIHWPFNLG